MKLGFGLEFSQLKDPQGLAKLDGLFEKYLLNHAPQLVSQWQAYQSRALKAEQASEWLLQAAVVVELFLEELFHLQLCLEEYRRRHEDETQVQLFKKQFVQRRARRYRGNISLSFSELDQWLSQQIGDTHGDRELAVARLGNQWLQAQPQHEKDLDRLVQWCVLGLKDPQGRRLMAGWRSFKLPQPLQAGQLVTFEPVAGDAYGRLQGCGAKRQRDGFELTDHRMSLRQVHDEVTYCIYCHDHDGDFCSKGFPEKKAQPELGLKKDVFGNYLTGCPLEEKISEMNRLRRDGRPLAALAVAMVDNPMLAATGHRICNDCMKACIYQKQDPVNIPEIETRVLTDILAMPHGAEVYLLLTLWNPLRIHDRRLQPYNGRKVLIAGMGPAGFTMAHYLSLQGCAVVGIDGLKIEPLPPTWLDSPIADYAAIEESLDERVLLGFGGVAEYGITVRWDKNFLKLIYISLLRRARVQVFGGVRFGGTLSAADAWELGFDHICLANGAGYPKVLNIKNALARGVRQANDFLMALQLTGAAKKSSLANLQLRMPAVVIGSGLTAIDTATEIQAYYIRFVEKTYRRHQQLQQHEKAAALDGIFDEESRAILREYLEHGRLVCAERDRARKDGSEPDFLKLIQSWGGVTVIYRRQLSESPAYRRNHEEVQKAFEEGIYYLQEYEPVEFELDEHDHVKAVLCRDKNGDSLAIPARAVMVATGARPNTIYAREHGEIQLLGDSIQPYEFNERLRQQQAAPHCKSSVGIFTSYQDQGRYISYVGDAHPVYHGSVVKAIASAKNGYLSVLQALQALPQKPASVALEQWQDDLAQKLTPRLAQVIEHDQVLELWVKAPLAVKNFKPGQFFRLQTFERGSERLADTCLQIPLQTISGAGVNEDCVRLLMLKMGPNAAIAGKLQPGDPLVLMGPNGKAAEICRNRTLLFIGGSWAAAVMLDLGPVLRAAGNRVIYMAAYGSSKDVYLKPDIEAAVDRVIWAVAKPPAIENEPGDMSFVEGNVISLIEKYAETDPQNDAELRAVDEVFVMGSTGLLSALQRAFTTQLAGRFKSSVEIKGTVGSPMQCMLKGVCAQCIQRRRDGTVYFSCAEQDQALMDIDTEVLAARQKQGRVAEILTGFWLNDLLSNQ